MVDVVCAGVLAVALVRLLMLGARRGWRWVPVDHPNSRSLHDNPVPRGGGLAVLLATILVAATSAQSLLNLLPPVVLLIAVSYLDDLRSRPASIRLLAHLAAGLWFGVSLGLESWQMVGAMVLLAAAANFTNFMDGANGLVGGMMVVGFGCLGILAVSAQQPDVATLCFALAGATTGFLFFNLPGGRIFLGDAGSVPLGFLTAAICLIGIQRGIWLPSLPLLLFMPLYADALLTLARRLLRGERIWQAHREHAFQRLVQSGWPHHRVAAVYAAATLVMAVLGAVSTQWDLSAQRYMLLFCMVFFLLLLSAVHHRCRLSKDVVSPH